jgi:hypothetical protein
MIINDNKIIYSSPFHYIKGISVILKKYITQNMEIKDYNNNNEIHRSIHNHFTISWSFTNTVSYLERTENNL